MKFSKSVDHESNEENPTFPIPGFPENKFTCQGKLKKSILLGCQFPSVIVNLAGSCSDCSEEHRQRRQLEHAFETSPIGEAIPLPAAHGPDGFRLHCSTPTIRFDRHGHFPSLDNPQWDTSTALPAVHLPGAPAAPVRLHTKASPRGDGCAAWPTASCS